MTDVEQIKELIEIYSKNLRTINIQIANHGMNTPIELLNQQTHYADEKARLQSQLIELLNADEQSLTSIDSTQVSKSILNEELEHRLRKLRAFRDIAVDIQDFIIDNADNPQLFIAPKLLEGFSYLYTEVARYMNEALETLGFEKSQIADSIMKFVTTPPSDSYRFIVETNQGLSFIRMALRYHELIEKKPNDIIEATE